MKKVLLSLSLFLIITVKLSAQTTYYWVGGPGASGAAIAWNNPEKWNTAIDSTGSPRTTPAVTDILVFDGTAPSLAINKSIFINAAKDSVAQLKLLNGVTVTVVNTVSGNTQLAGTVTYGATVGANIVPVYGTGITSIFKLGDYVSSGTGMANMSQIIGINGPDTLYLSNENILNTVTTLYKASTIYITGNPGLTIDASSTFNFGIGSSTTMSSLVIYLNAGATGNISGKFNFQGRGAGGRLYAASPNSLFFKSGSSCLNGTNHGVTTTPNSIPFVFGNPMTTGSLAAGTLALVNSGEPIVFEAGSTYTHPQIGSGGSAYKMNSPFGVTIITGSTYPFTPVVKFAPASNYVVAYGNAYPPYFYSINATNYSPQSAASFGNVTFSGSIPSKSATIALFFLPKRCDTLTIAATSTFTAASTNYINNTVAPPAFIYGTIINNSTAPLNFGKVMFMGANATIGAGTTQPQFTNLLVGDGATLTLSNNITVTGTSPTVAPTGKLDLGNYTITGTGASFNPLGSYNTTHNKPANSGSASGGCAATINSNTIQVRNITNIPVGSIVSSSSHPNLFPAGTMVLNYNGGGNFFLSNAATATVDSTSTPELSLTFTTAGSNTVTSNTAGLDGSLIAFTTVNSATGASYTFNTATTTPFNTLTASPINAGSITVNANTTLNKAIVNLSGTLNLNAGILTLRTGDSLRINSGNEIAGTPFSNTKFIDTKVDVATGAVGVLDIENFSTARLFPVGTNGNYLPVTITPDSTSGFAVTAFNGATQNGLPNGTPLLAAQKDTSVDASYMINRVFPNNVNTHTATLTLGFPSSLMGTTFATLGGKVGISHYNGTTWDAVMGAGSVSSLSATASFSSFSPFLVTKNANAVLPVKFGSINAVLVSAKEVKVNWTIYTEINTDKYVIEHSIDGIHFTEIGTVKASNFNAYSFTDFAPQSGINYYRIAGMDKGSNEKQYSNTVKISIKNSNAGLSVYPNPVKGGQLNFQISDLKQGKVTVMLYNNMGQSVYTTVLNYNGGVLAQSAQLPSMLLNGNYEMVVTDGITTLKQKVLILQ